MTAFKNIEVSTLCFFQSTFGNQTCNMALDIMKCVPATSHLGRGFPSYIMLYPAISHFVMWKSCHVPKSIGYSLSQTPSSNQGGCRRFTPLNSNGGLDFQVPGRWTHPIHLLLRKSRGARREWLGLPGNGLRHGLPEIQGEAAPLCLFCLFCYKKHMIKDIDILDSHKPKQSTLRAST